MVSVTKHTVRVESLGRLEMLVAEHNSKVSKLNKRHGAALSSMSFKVLGTWTAGPVDVAKIDDDVTCRPYQEGTIVADVEVTGEKPVLAGWAIVGVLTATDEGYLVSRVRDAKYEDVAPFAKRGGECDHCKAARRRTTTYLLRKDGDETSCINHKHTNLRECSPECFGREIRVIGSTCLKDFTGHSSPAALLAYADYSVGFDAELAELDDMDGEGGRGGGGGGRQGAVALAKYLAFVRQDIRKNGWLSKGKVFEQGHGVPTATRAWEAMSTISLIARTMGALPLLPDGRRGRTLADEEKFVAYKNQIEAMLPADDDVQQASSDLSLVDETFSALVSLDDFQGNTLTVVRQGYAFGKNLGLAAAICKAADRIRGDVQKKNDRASEKNEHFGTVGKREVFTLKCVFDTTVEGQFGTTQLCIFRDKDGRSAKWFNSGRTEIKRGETYQIKGTVKKHDVWEGKLTTLLSRCVIQEQAGPAAAKEEAKAS